MIDMRWPYRATVLDSREPDTLLYHYTTTDGLLAIVRSKTIWATDLGYLNDSMELEHGLRQFLEMAQDLLSPVSVPSSATLSRLAGFEASTDLEELFRSRILVGLRQQNVLGVTCFCENGDLLSQWRGYGISGYSVGFEPGTLRECVAEAALPLAPVVYGDAGVADSSASEVILDFLELYLPSLADLQNDPDDFEPTPEQVRAAVAFLFLASQVKDEAFAGEREWRIADIAEVTDSLVGFRVGNLGVTPYINLHIREQESELLLPIREVVLSPGPEQEVRVQAVKSLLLNHGYSLSDVAVRPSKIPYRG